MEIIKYIRKNKDGDIKSKAAIVSRDVSYMSYFYLSKSEKVPVPCWCLKIMLKCGQELMLYANDKTEEEKLYAILKNWVDQYEPKKAN